MGAPQYIPDAAIECVGAIELDPCSNSQEIPNMPTARHSTVQDNGLCSMSGMDRSDLRRRLRGLGLYGSCLAQVGLSAIYRIKNEIDKSVYLIYSKIKVVRLIWCLQYVSKNSG
jgi:hypothetical protein